MQPERQSIIVGAKNHWHVDSRSIIDNIESNVYLIAVDSGYEQTRGGKKIELVSLCMGHFSPLNYLKKYTTWDIITIETIYKPKKSHIQ